MRRTIALSAFFSSGFAGLVYQVCWIREASLVFGSTTLAMSTVVAVFFLGLAVGSYTFARIGQATTRPLRLFVLAELGLAALALASGFGFHTIDAIYGAAYRVVGDALVSLTLIRLGLVTLLLFPPTFLMGGTLPLFCRQFVVNEATISGTVGLLYGVNTLGAAAGCVAAGFWLIPHIGLQGTIALAVPTKAMEIGSGIRYPELTSRDQWPVWPLNGPPTIREAQINW